MVWDKRKYESPEFVIDLFKYRIKVKRHLYEEKSVYAKLLAVSNLENSNYATDSVQVTRVWISKREFKTQIQLVQTTEK